MAEINNVIKSAQIIISSILLWMLGLLLISLIKGINLEGELKANATYIVELSPNVLPGQRITAESLLKDMKGIVSASVTHVDKSEALETMLRDYPNLSSSEWENPFRDILTFTADGLNADELMVLKEEIEKIPGVSAMFFEKEMFAGVTSGIARFRLALLLLTAVLLLAVTLMIIYAIRQQLLRNKPVMQIKNYAGTLDADIIKPYIQSGIQEGFLAGIMGSALLILNILLINGNLLKGVEISFLQTLIACVCVILISLALYLITTTLTTRRFLHSI